ncbi:MAG TPA: IS1595 family transposase [Stellaceae bacterium]|jgi:transposase-like protein|nr:IS1595 family transposase [Stellaceae bacterium]
MPSVLSAAHFHNEEAAYAFVEAWLWSTGRVCPHCGIVDQSGPLKGKSTRIGVYKCYACRKPFTIKVGTVFESSHIKLHVWLQAIHLMASSKKGFSTNQFARILGVTIQTAWFLSHRIREAMIDIAPQGPLGGEGKFVEADETFIGGRARNRAYREPAPKKAVVALVERRGRVRSRHVPEVNAANLRPILEAGIDKASHLRTDESGVYWKIGEAFASHQTVVHSADEYVRGDAHTNTAESFFSVLKRGIYGVYQHVSEEHLHRYLAEFDFRHNNRIALGVDDTDRAGNILSGVKGKRLTYRTTRRQVSAQND